MINWYVIVISLNKKGYLPKLFSDLLINLSIVHCLMYSLQRFIQTNMRLLIDLQAQTHSVFIINWTWVSSRLTEKGELSIHFKARKRIISSVKVSILYESIAFITNSYSLSVVWWNSHEFPSNNIVVTKIGLFLYDKIITY